MRVHHLNCATMCPMSARLVNGRGGWIAPARMVCHVLLIETDRGLVLVDTGLGLDDVRDAKRRLGAPFVVVTRPRRDPEETAAQQIEKLGFSRDDVRHIVVTHLDLDHAGGLPDFPKAKVHVYAPEHQAAMERANAAARARYRPCHFAHDPDWVLYPSASGERWFGFECVRQLEGLPPEIVMVPVTGHSAGHALIAVDTGNDWLAHAGDAYFHHLEMGEKYRCTPGLRLFQRLVAHDDDARVRNRERLRAVVREMSGAIRVFSAHDPFELDALVAGALPEEAQPSGMEKRAR